MDEDLREIAKDSINKSFFIDKRGKIIKWKWDVKEASTYVSMHYGIAHKLFPDIEHPVDYVHNIGWITIGSISYGKRIKNEPNQSQLNTLFDLGIKKIIDDNGNVYKIY